MPRVLRAGNHCPECGTSAGRGMLVDDGLGGALQCNSCDYVGAARTETDEGY